MQKTFIKIIILSISITFVAAVSLAVAKPLVWDEKVITQETALGLRDGPGNPSFPLKEKLVYRMKWLGIPAGELISEVQGLGKWRGRKAYRIKVHARTIGLPAKLYKIDDHYVSYMDAEHFHTLRHEVHRREGGYVKDAVTEFDQVNHKAYFHSFTDGTSKIYDIPPHTHDTVTAAYYSRFLPLIEGRKFGLRVANSEKNYDLFLNIDRKVKRSFRMGEFEVYHFQPYARHKGEQVREGRLNGYITADQFRYPLQVIIKAPVFTSVTATLIHVDR